jgi:hypothetical protein
MPLVRTLQVTNTARRPASETEQGQQLCQRLAVHKTRENSVVVLTMGSSVFKARQGELEAVVARCSAGKPLIVVVPRSVKGM